MQDSNAGRNHVNSRGRRRVPAPAMAVLLFCFVAPLAAAQGDSLLHDDLFFGIKLPDLLAGEFGSGESPRLQEARPRVRKLIDWSRAEIGVLGGPVGYSEDFQDENHGGGGGGIFHVPTGLIRSVEIGGFIEVIGTQLSRDIEFFREHPSGNVQALGGGVDVTLRLSPEVYIRGQVGGMHVLFHGIDGAKDGPGLLSGFVLGVRAGKAPAPVWLILNPQFLWDGDDWIFLGMAGIQIDL